jgi:hypothetical protein
MAPTHVSLVPIGSTERPLLRKSNGRAGFHQSVLSRWTGGGPPGPDDTGPDDTGPDDTGPDDIGPDDIGPDDIGPDDTWATTAHLRQGVKFRDGTDINADAVIWKMRVR